MTADMLGPGGSLTVSIGSELVSAPVQRNVTDFVVLSGLSMGKQLALRLLLQEAMLYTVGFAA